MAAPDPSSYWRRLAHRWFVEYNPLYLVSAALVLVGMNLLSGALAERSFLLGQVGIPAIAELYGWALIGGAALLRRIELRRPAVMLALLAALYQCDLTLHTETTVFLGAVGTLAAAAWWVGFVAKLGALAWAMRVRLSRSAWLLPSIAALGMAAIPHQLPHLTARGASAVVGAWAFAVVASALWTEHRVTSLETLDGWGRTVLRRTVRAMWVMWGVAFIAHLAFWCWDFRVSKAALIPVVMLLATRLADREREVWALAGAAVAVAVTWSPELTSLVSALVAATLALRAWRQPHHEAPTPASAPAYRSRGEHPSPRPRVTFRQADPSARSRLLLGAAGAAYLALWTLGWTGGPWPAHNLALDGVATLCAVMAWRGKSRRPLGAVASIHLHHAIAVGLLGLPATPLGWGALLVAAGFAMLIALLVLSYRRQRHLR